jgi:hypothetical protein
MQTQPTLRPVPQSTQPASPRPVLSPRGERAADESLRPAVALEPHWAAAIDAATD